MKERLNYLLHRVNSDQAAEAEYNELLDMIRLDLSGEIGAQINNFLATKLIEDSFYSSAQMDELFSSVMVADRLSSSANHVKEGTVSQRAHPVHFLRTAWFRYAAAIILLLGMGGYLLWRESGEIPARGENDKGGVNEVKINTNSNKAILTLADGSQIVLDEKAVGNIAQQGNTKIIKLDGNQLSYNAGGDGLRKAQPVRAGEANVKYNTITTPKGGQYQIILPDGSRVWLNAVSSIKFPTSFTGNTRMVEITGEAYMEIVKNSGQPFLVKAAGTEVQVLGTSFNINAYSDEKSIKTTLIEGSIKVTLRPFDAERSRNAQGSSGLNASELLKPGQQAQIDVTTDQINVMSGADIIEKAIAWKNGLFNFEGLGVKEVMNQLQRWYDIEVIYESGIPDITFFGKMGKDVDLSVVLKLLKGMNISFRMEGRKLIISQKK